MTIQIDKSKELVCKDIVKAIRKCVVSKDNIQIEIRPSFSDPFAARGTINLKLASVDNDKKTVISCQVLPTKPSNYRLFVLLLVLIIWTIAALLISTTIYSILTVILGWTTIIGIVFTSQTLNKKKLDNYIDFILSTIKSEQQKSGA